MIDNETLLGYALNALEPAESEAVRTRLKDDTASKVNLERIQRMLQPLEADREAPRPPSNLSSATLAKLDMSLVAPKPRGGFVASRWVELALAASIGLLGFGVVATAIGKLQADERRTACQNNLRQIFASLDGYADTHQNRYPQAGIDAPTAGDFHTVLHRSGNWPEQLKPRCLDTQPVGYTYTLGHREGGKLIGPARSPLNDIMPLAGDFPSSNAKIEGSISPHGRGQNVLFSDGTVRYSLLPKLGNDNIYLNDANQRRAGLHSHDAVLGQPADEP